MAIQLDLNPAQLGAIVELILGLVHIDDDFDFETFDMEGACEVLIEDEIESNAIINLLLQVAQVDDFFDAKEHEYISEVADLIGADLEDLEIELIDGIEILPPKIPDE